MVTVEEPIGIGKGLKKNVVPQKEVKLTKTDVAEKNLNYNVGI
jgi:hypothetical protein